MSRILSLDLFDSEKFEKIDNPSDVQLGECIIYGALNDLDLTEINSDFITDSGNFGFIDVMLLDLQDPVSEECESERNLLIDLLSKLSENNGRLSEKFGQIDPFFFGYLTVTETNDLVKALTNLPEELDEGWTSEFRDILLLIGERAVQKKLGLIFQGSP